MGLWDRFSRLICVGSVSVQGRGLVVQGSVPYLHLYPYLCLHLRLFLVLHLYVLIFVHICSFTCIHICTYIHVYVYMYKLTYLHMHTYLHTYKHTYMHTYNTHIHTHACHTCISMYDLCTYSNMYMCLLCTCAAATRLYVLMYMNT